MTREWLIFALGTNNWQAKGDFAPGSGILHEGQHVAMNSISGTRCYSMWPSDVSKSPKDRDDYRVYEIPHQIPICESVGPQSCKRWHSMSEEEVQHYCDELQKQVVEYIKYAEEKEGKPFDLFLAHHTFMNPVIMIKVNKARVAAGLPAVPLVIFAHGTALKMYQNELNKLPDFPMRFYDWIRNTMGVFESLESICGVFAVSQPQKDTFESLFPAFPKERVLLAPCGYNQLLFHPIKNATPQTAFGSLPQILYDGFDVNSLPDACRSVIAPGKTIPNLDTYEKIVIFCGRFADWKRPDAVLQAASHWEKQNPKILTLMVGGGSQEARKKYVDIAYNELQLTHTFFLGPQGQDVLANLYTVADVAAFPSKDEPFGMVFIECMACGTPVIGAQSGGPMDFVNDSVGTLVQEGDTDAVSSAVHDAVLKALKEDWKKTKGEVCEKYALEKYSLTTQCEHMLEDIEAHFLPK